VNGGGGCCALLFMVGVEAACGGISLPALTLGAQLHVEIAMAKIFHWPSNRPF
jgi:hypothetical protein